MAQIRKRKSSKTVRPEMKIASQREYGSTSFDVHLPSERIIRQVCLLSILSVLIFAVGTYHVQAIHENERSFSDLSDLEREITFKSEMGLYYYFYKTFVQAETWVEGIWKLRHENFTEYPDRINAFHRFNILPEISIGVLYRVLKYFDLLSRECFSYKRDDGFTYDTCIGMGEPIFFYLQFAWYSAGFTALFVFYFGLYLSKSAFGGFLSVLSYFFNHAECSRIQWTPPLRETFTYPLLLLEMLVVTFTLDKKSKYNTFRPFLSHEGESESSHQISYWLMIHLSILSILTFFTLTFWQFSQFVLFTQFSIILFFYICGELTEEFMLLFSASQLIGLTVAIAFLEFNDMLISSLFGCMVFATFMTFITYRYMNAPEPLKKIFLVLIVPYFAWMLRNSVSSEDDNHIFNLLRSKISSYEDFHTLIYTCSAEYNFLPISVPINLSYTGLIPIVAFITLCLFYLWIKTVKLHKIFGDIEIHIVYNLLQCVIFCIMAFLFMRLKLFSNPHLCILASLFTSKYMPRVIQQYNVVLFLAVVLGMSYNGVINITTQHSNIGTFSYPPLENLLNFINKSVPQNAVFAGPMTTSAAVLLSTHRPIVLHPHYEHVKIRNRTKEVYSIFSRKDENEVYRKLNALNINYVIIDYVWCYSESKIGCLLTSAWDTEDAKNRNKDSFCSRVYENSCHLSKFEHIYKNQIFSLLKLKK